MKTKTHRRLGFRRYRAKPRKIKARSSRRQVRQ